MKYYCLVSLIVISFIVCTCAAPASGPAAAPPPQPSAQTSAPASAPVPEEGPVPAPGPELAPIGPAPVAEGDIPIIDAHSQIDQQVKMDKVINMLDQAGIAAIILSTRWMASQADLLGLLLSGPLHEQCVGLTLAARGERCPVFDQPGMTPHRR